MPLIRNEKNPIRILRSRQFQQFKKSFLQIRGFPFSEILSTELLTRICAHNERGRERIFTPFTVGDVQGISVSGTR